MAMPPAGPEYADKRVANNIHYVWGLDDAPDSPSMKSTRASLSPWQTGRLLLVRPTLGDLGDLLRMEQDAPTMAMLLGTRTPEQTRAALDRMMGAWDADGFGWWIARDPGTSEFLGRGGLRRVKVGDSVEVEVGYGFRAEVWGRGLATELAREAVRVGFEVLGLESIISFTLPHNRASRRVMEKAGFRYERDGEWAGHPHVFYRITA